ncbi:MAG TPA: nuclear transport factor 2 family protein [Thermoanaerobaculia bacterium]|nr:nuclear transport factor 2 family protein [Thermoanaerobaculia bacterium]
MTKFDEIAFAMWRRRALLGAGGALLIIVVMACSSTPSDHGTQIRLQATTVEREIRHITTVEWPRALKEADVAWFDRHLADELLVTTGRTGRVTTKAEEIADVKPSATSSGGGEKIDDLKVRAYGDVAVTTFLIDVTGVDKTGPYHRVARYTEVWLHRDGRWQLVTSHSSLVPGQP